MAKKEVTDIERKDIREAFDILDNDKDGKLSIPELETLLRGQFVVANDRELKELLDNMDADKNGYVDYAEFEAFVAKNNLCRANAEEVSAEMRDAFQVFDTDRDGFIGVEEFRAVMTNIGDKLTDEEVTNLMDQADTNKDGRIDYKEFCAFMASGIY
ncbi:calmodulin-beta-like isoform X2 [Littorina saxatilis]|uniref:EF-hand domain-containing protein n=1 Tax=Littorina saxatilis TaxID=31220 RepID=A0AAN9G1S7_9CAEN